ncbi:superoxide dismutase [Ni] [Desulfoluna spongiiphila]|uniref:Nickel superoxide dismutase n=1 Tax=Desulfoluna spongiiphila TaxID=419481 RepID=A0A1G5GBR7_9BACT|nr:superoxide dismutase [Ni] [Desulfoluna spongiiphila]SCY48178.1 nickel superoxide dismutase [Desulfoluna spongiiphila]VVS93697.1 superoxide dismutase nickel-type [Desulfoluna spongiiphila]
MKRSFFGLFLAWAVLLSTPTAALAHCEIPCGIYNDEMRFEMILEHIKTIEKSMNAINDLSLADKGNTNQVVRWVSNKERHAEEIQEIATQYFLAQRVKIPKGTKGMKDYVESLKYIHQLVVFAMKAKQSTDIKHVKALQETTEAYRALYRKMTGH